MYSRSGSAVRAAGGGGGAAEVGEGGGDVLEIKGDVDAVAVVMNTVNVLQLLVAVVMNTVNVWRS